MKNKKNIVLMFPGQGSQYLKMGSSFLAAHRKYMQYFDIAGTVVGENIIDIIEDNNDKGRYLDDTRYSQIAIYALSCALSDFLFNEKKISVDSVFTVTGHSLGDYSALYTCKAFDFEKGAGLVGFRSRIMAEAAAKNGGQMMMAAVIGFETEKIAAILQSYKGRVFIANINDVSQTVISGYAADVLKAGEEIKAGGARKVIPLKVNIASHCPLMKEVSGNLSKYLKENFKNFNDLKINFFSSTELKDIKRNHIENTLTSQLLNPVKWKESVEIITSSISGNLKSLSYEKAVFIEVGPGKVLSGLVKRILSQKNADDFELFNMDSIEEIERIDI